MHPLAYHLTWTTYGTWLPGDTRGWVQAGALGVQAPDPERERQARESMAEAAVLISPEQRKLVTDTLTDHARLRG